MTHEQTHSHGSEHAHAHEAPHHHSFKHGFLAWLKGWLFTTNHKDIGTLYLFLV